jgi:uncharacterized membrane protein YkvA (DUF1232 family)
MTQSQTPPSRDANWVVAQVRKLRLSWRLLRDPLVPLWVKLIPVGAVAYILLPIDLIPDAIPVLGQLDDLGVLLLGLRWFLALSPADVVRRHLTEMSSVKADYRVVAEDAPAPQQVAGYLDVESHTPDEQVDAEKK